jgi:hypothetical protein
MTLIKTTSFLCLVVHLKWIFIKERFIKEGTLKENDKILENVGQ